MTISNIYDVKEWFKVLQTTERIQTAVMVLTAGSHSSEEMNVHEKSDQVLLLLEGEIQAEVGGEKRIMRKGDTYIVAAGTPHRFENRGKDRALTFNVYSPPEYSPKEKGLISIMTHHFRFVSRLVFFALVIGASFTMVMTPMRGSETAEHQKKLNGAYYLLHKLSEDEAQVPLLLDVKHAPSEVTAYADRISKKSKETIATLARLQKGAPSIQFDRNPLPQIEQDTRASIKADKQHQLLFGTTDSEFVRAFMVAQIEACTYALNLSKVLAEQETDPDRGKTLQHMSAQWLGLRNEAFRILRNY